MANTVAPATSSDGDVADTRSVARQLGLGFWLSAGFVVLMAVSYTHLTLPTKRIV